MCEKIEAFLRIKGAQQLFELEKQLLTQSLDLETVRAEYRFFSHSPKYTEIRAINPKGRNKVIRFVDNEEDFLEYVKAFDGKWQVYMGINVNIAWELVKWELEQSKI